MEIILAMFKIERAKKWKQSLAMFKIMRTKYCSGNNPEHFFNIEG